ncbi:hypothetical protein D3C72_2384770 [compost metagenome]
MICCSRKESPITCSGTSLCTSSVNSSPFSWALGASSTITSSSVSRSANGICSSTSLPASSLEKSSTSLMMVSRLLAERSMVCR